MIQNKKKPEITRAFIKTKREKNEDIHHRSSLSTFIDFLSLK